MTGRKRTYRSPATAPNLTVNGPIHYAMEKGKFYMLNDDGMYFEMTMLDMATLPRRHYHDSVLTLDW